MTNDAKKGLLVALLLIVAIVFAVNGLPKVFSGNNPLTQQSYARPGIVRETGDDLMAMARDTVKILNEPAPQEIAPAVAVEKIIEKPIVVKKADEPTPVTEKQIYVVQANDNLADIAKKFYGDELGNKLSNIAKIAKANELGSSDFIFSLPTVSASQKVSKGQYAVTAGDTLWKIAKKTLGDGNRYKELAKLNHLKDSDSLQVGDLLLLPR